MTKETKPVGTALSAFFSEVQGSLPVARASGGLLARASGRAVATQPVARPAAAATQASGGDAPDFGKIGIIVDATASREKGWERKKTTHIDLIEQATRFSAQFSLRLVTHNGRGVVDGGWTRDPEILRRTIKQLGTKSAATQIAPSLRQFLDAPQGRLPAAIILVGDCCEETPFAITAVAQQLKRAGIAVFTFQEGEDPGAKEAFEILATTTGGACAAFGDRIDFKAFCQAVASFVTGGREGLLALAQQTGGENAQKFLKQIPQTQTARPAAALPFCHLGKG